VLVDRIGRHAEQRTPRAASATAHALDLVRATKGQCAVERIAERLRVSPRYLRRAVDRETGLSLKRYARVVRLLNAVTTADDWPATKVQSWAGVAAESGFYDQSHLIRECHDLCGLTPGEIMRERIMEDQTEP
jgi:AraC-like DNA-binding protein